MEPYNGDSLPKALALKGAIIFLIFTLAAVYKYPGYSFWNNYLSALGARNPSAPYFNVGVILTGLLLTTLFLVLYTRILGISKPLSVRLPLVFGAVAGISLAGVGIFPSTMNLEHLIAALAFFLFMGLSILFFTNLYRLERQKPMMVLGAVTFIVDMLLILFNHTDYGPGLQKITVGLILIFTITFTFNLPEPFTLSQPLEA